MSESNLREDAGRPEQSLKVIQDPSKTVHQQLADVSLSPVTRAALVSKAWSEKTMGEIGLNEAVSFIGERANGAASGDLNAAKAMLMAQALTMDAIFNDMANRAANLVKDKQGGGWTFSAETMEACTRVAFKAQAQCRATLQTLGELVNPRSVAFIKQAPGSQANVTQGAQQVNNGAGQAPAHGNTDTPTNKLLEANPSERLDIGAQAAAGGANPGLETVGAIDRTKDGSGQVRNIKERAQARGAERKGSGK